ncbi:serine hydrolase domain-containing protein [Chitinophagaceae bacterium MMS25-I14]
MRRIFSTYLCTISVAMFFVACHSGGEKASAHPPGFHDKPGQMGSIKLNYADTTSPEWKEMIQKLDSYYNAQTRAGFNGSVLVGYQGKILYERYYGFANREAGQRLESTSGVQLASVSKTFTGAAIMYLYQNKYLNIDDPVQHYIKDFPYPELTLRMLLCHRSGLPDYTHWVPTYVKDTKTPIYNEQMLKLMAQYKPHLEFKANTRFKYSNTNYATLARVIEIVTEMKYKDFMKKYIFDPIGMTSTFVFDPATPVPANTTVSYKYNWTREPVMFADGVYGDKGIYSTVEDMYRWDQSFYKNILLSNETLELAYGPCSFEKPGVKNYGLGWRMLCYPDGYKIIYHNGWWHGNNTSFYRFVKDNFTIIVLGNKYNTGIYHQAPIIYSIVKNKQTSDFDDGE